MQHRYERKTWSVAYKSLRSQHKYLKENRRELYDNVFLRYFSRYWKFIDDSWEEISSLEEFWKAMGLYTMVDSVGTYVNKSIILWYKVGFRQNKNVLINFWISFDLQNPVVSEYMDTFSALHLSDRYGSISLTTKNAVLAELRKWISESLSYTDIAKNINALDSQIFSKSRAKLIATREIGKAYEVWNYIPMREAKAQWAKVNKYWKTVWDDRVTEPCKENQAAWWIELDTPWPTGDIETPRDWNPRCRCSTRFDIR